LQFFWAEFSALVANQTLSLKMHLNWFQTLTCNAKDVQSTPSTMAAVLNLEDKIVEDICASIDELIVAAIITVRDNWLFLVKIQNG
jgi:[acyl-carrier-protein] S-malonyltransferase